ncbi:hypothetical protein LTR84_001227 [Exophiala bonariae]|uniref:Zn(2)-C6 fungal-type domain-containing protein n=1 Tax=Exophiala bonariae TaxID=1690606 RepID=A0AAV9NUI4_9EURO|nr:hypothetical protein LTR84_001227 [Exophiala bonariae]
MVGIARRRGCATCRKRKILCGQERPTCAQCIKSKRECTGYRDYPVFVTYEKPTPKPVSGQVLKSEPPQDSQSKHVARQRHIGLSKTNSNFPNLTPCKVLTSEIATRPFSKQISYKPAYRQQILCIYMDQIVPKVDLGLLKDRMWIESVPCLPYLTSALESSIMAMCFAKIGDFNGDERFKLEGLQLYHRALRELRMALLHPQLLYDDQTLGACVALTHYEMTECPSDSMQPYLSHVTGCEKLICLRGPEKHRDGMAHKIFAHFRVQGILYNLGIHKPTFLADPDWQRIPWQNTSKSAYDKIWDLLSFAPELVAKGDMIAKMEPELQANVATDLLSKCWELDHELMLVYDRVMSSGEQPTYWTQLASNVTATEEEIMFPLALNFRDLNIANTLLMMWSTQTILWHGMMRLTELLHYLQCTLPDGNKVQTLVLHELGQQRDYMIPARNILRSVEYCSREEFLDLGPKSIAAPLRIAIDILKLYPSHEQEELWGRLMLQKVYTRSLRLLSFYDESGIDPSAAGRHFYDASRYDRSKMRRRTVKIDSAL